MMVDEYTGIRFLNWYRTKIGMIEPTAAQFYQWFGKNIKVRYVRCDNARENVELNEVVTGNKWKMVMDFEYTACDTPQQNHLAEIGIYTISCKGRAMMSRALIPKVYRFRGFFLATEMACQLDWLTAITIDI